MIELSLQDKLTRANCFNRLCDKCVLLCKEECIQTADTHKIRSYVSDLENKYTNLKETIVYINDMFSQGDFGRGIAELIKLCKQLEQE